MEASSSQIDSASLEGWAGYAKKNSYQCDRAQLRDKLDANVDGKGPQARESDWSDDWRQPQRKSEGRGWAKPGCDLSDNTYTTDKGSKRD